MRCVNHKNRSSDILNLFINRKWWFIDHVPIYIKFTKTLKVNDFPFVLNDINPILGFSNHIIKKWRIVRKVTQDNSLLG